MTSRLALLAILAAAVSSALVSPPAGAEDHRPCVSRAEFRTVPGMAYMTGRVNPGHLLTRRALEARWDVTGLGVIDPEFSDRASTMWMYPVCGYDFTEAQVWVMTTGRNGTANLAYRWYEAGATVHGPERLAE